MESECVDITVEAANMQYDVTAVNFSVQLFGRSAKDSFVFLLGAFGTVEALLVGLDWNYETKRAVSVESYHVRTCLLRGDSCISLFSGVPVLERFANVFYRIRRIYL